MAPKTTRTASAPPGFLLVPELLSPAEHAALAAKLQLLELEEVRMHGVVARRTVAHFGWLYGYDSARVRPGPELPRFLLDLRARCARLIDLDAEQLEEVLVTRYPPGAAIGWHRDAPTFGNAVVGVSLLGACSMRFRRETAEGWLRYDQLLEPRSAYVISGKARTLWQHSIAPVKSLRYSITFRTLRGKARRSA